MCQSSVCVCPLVCVCVCLCVLMMSPTRWPSYSLPRWPRPLNPSLAPFNPSPASHGMVRFDLRFVDPSPQTSHIETQRDCHCLRDRSANVRRQVFLPHSHPQIILMLSNENPPLCPSLLPSLASIHQLLPFTPP